MRQLPKNLRIEITEEDIFHGVAGNGSLCPVGLATRRVVNERGWNTSVVFVDGAYADIHVEDERQVDYRLT